MKREQEMTLRMRPAIAGWASERLRVPNIYFEAAWMRRSRLVDILAIDRAGSGDVHGFELKKSTGELQNAAECILRISAQFRWIAAYVGDAANAGIDASRRLKKTLKDALKPYPDEGGGRVGILLVERSDRDGLDVNVLVQAERFPGSYYDEVDRFVTRHKPDVMFR